MFDWFAYPFALYAPEVIFAFGAGVTHLRTSHSKDTMGFYFGVEAFL